ncbi:peptidoglycan recognition protein family protein [Kitasatospora sp. NPDC054939]
MAWYPGAKKLELQPESDAQPAIRPTQLILHSIAAPWTPERTYEFWRDSTGLESHFGLGFDGRLAQYIGTETRADANMYANRRPDGTGAVSVETASNTSHSDPWTDAQLRALIELGLWLHRQHGIPLRACRSHDDPGFGFHRMYPQWSDGGTACPGDARVRQFHDIVLPGIIAAASGKPTTPAPEEDDMPYSKQELTAIAASPEVRDTLAWAQLYWQKAVLKNEVPEGAPWGMQQIVPELHEEFKATLAEVVQAVVGPAVAAALASGIELQITVTPKEN